jgi:hypothetical protein
METSRIEAAIEALEEGLRSLDPDVVDRGLAGRLLSLFSRGERACAGAAAMLALRVGDPRLVARQSGTSMGKARAIVGLSKRLVDTPDLNDAVRRGAVSLDQAAEIAKAETAAPGCAGELVEVARNEPFHVLKARARTAVLEDRRPGLGARQHAARRAAHHITDLGLVHLEADLEPHVGASIIERLEAEARSLAASDGDTPWSARLADAFAACFDRPGAKRSGKPEVVVVVSHEVAARGWDEVADGEMCKIPGVGPIDAAVAKEIAEDAFLTGVVCDGKDLRQIRRWTRTIPVEVRLALRLGTPPTFDGPRCIDCGNRFRIEFDHDQPLSEGGPTSIDNLPARCASCHVRKTARDRARRRRLAVASPRRERDSPPP